MKENSMPSVDINLNDFATVVNIIDVCTKRGAFEGNELLLIGELRKKFTTFIEQNKTAPSQSGQVNEQAPSTTPVNENNSGE